MRLDEWQKYIESQFLDDEPASPPQAKAKASVPVPSTPEPAVPAPPPATPVTPSQSARVSPPPLARVPAPPPLTTMNPPPLKTPPVPPSTAPKPIPTGTGTPKPAPPQSSLPNLWGLDTEIPEFEGFLAKKGASEPTTETPKPALKPLPPPATKTERRENSTPPKTGSTQRARHARNVRPESVPTGLSIVKAWQNVPRHVEILLNMSKQDVSEVAQNSYKRPFAEQRRDLIERILDPILSLEETARLLNVCPTTVRRYTNKGILTCYRKEVEHTSDATGGKKETRQRRFRLSDILAFLEAQQLVIEADRKADAKRLYSDSESSQ